MPTPLYFVPGGHGAMIGIPDDKNVAKILRWAHEKDVFTITLCHGPGAFLSTTLDNQAFLYKGYNMAVFPDSVDNQTPMVGYLPGKMAIGVSETLKSLGVNLMNTQDGQDRLRRPRRHHRSQPAGFQRTRQARRQNPARKIQLNHSIETG